ncbi:MAG TPA: metal ABC transporter substrate-binding protein [Beijerinckiaceae bacterium]|nr:metal ABC transporter substrate-binding protein [Beijerinckiaceae bacterium]
MPRGRRFPRSASAFLTGLWFVASTFASEGAEPLVVATTPDLKSITEAIAGGSARVESLVPPGADAEAFEPRPSHLALVRDAALVVRVGLGFDEWLDRLLRQAGNASLQRGGAGYLDASNDIALVEVQGRSVEARSGHAHGAANPHYWLDPVNAEIMSAHIAEALTRVVPDKRDAIVAAQARFAADLKAAVQRWSGALEPYRGAAVVAYHNSWPYFARRFRLNIVDVIETKEGVPPNAARLAALAARMREHKVRVILHEPFEPVEASRFLAERSGARVVLLAPSVGSKPEAKDFFALFDHNIDLLTKALAESR